MAKFSPRAVCPQCNTRRMQRVERKSWMRHLPSSKLYQCKDCGARVLYLNRWLKWRLSSVSTQPLYQQLKGSSRASSRYVHMVKSLLYLNDEELLQLKRDIDTALKERQIGSDSQAAAENDFSLPLKEIER